MHHHQEFEAPEELRDIIKCFWYTRRDFGAQISNFEIVPDSYAEIVFHFGSVCSLSDQETLQPLPSPFMMGLLNQPVMLKAKGRLEVIGIRCFPWSVFEFLGLPSDKGGIHIFEHPIARLQTPLEACMRAGELKPARALIEQYCLGARAQLVLDGTLLKAGEVMREANGQLPVTQVAEAAHATVRTLERKFKQSSGHTVKDVSGLIRFEQVRNHLWLHPQTHLAELAHELGYTDQSHLSREFKRYSGTTPAAFARKARFEQQAISRNFVAFVQA